MRLVENEPGAAAWLLVLQAIEDLLVSRPREGEGDGALDREPHLGAIDPQAAIRSPEVSASLTRCVVQKTRPRLRLPHPACNAKACGKPRSILPFVGGHGEADLDPYLTPPQRRVLRFCAEWPGWLSLLELSMVLEPDDVVTVPSLVAATLLEHNVRLRIIRATEAGRVAAR
jgi:hypothetical protein